MRNVPRIALVLVIGVLLGALLTLGYLQTQAGLAADPTLAAAATAERTPTPVPTEPQLVPTQSLFDEDVVVRVYEQVSPAVVNITSNIQAAFGAEPQDVPAGTGSGFIIDEQGHIITNNHVVARAQSLDVTLADGTTLPATVLGRDPASDLAVVKVDLPQNLLRSGRITVATLGDSDLVRVGQLAIAIGNPFGFQRTVTVGVVSGMGREIPGASARPIRGGIQTDAAINPGNSGGPLLNSAGEVIGINSSIESPVRGSVGVGFAVPVNTAKRYLDAMIAGRRVEHPWLGISGTSVTNRVAEQLGLSVERGVYVMQVIPDSPAQRAGLRGAMPPGQSPAEELPRGGDVIVAIDGVEVTAVAQIAEYLEFRKQVGDTVDLTVRRGAEEITLAATLAAWPDD